MPRSLRPLTALATAALAAGVLAGCTGTLFDDGCPVYPAGDASTTVTASGDVGEEPTIDYPTPLIAPSPELSVVTAGEGPRIGSGEAVAIEYTLLDAADGSVLQASSYGGPGTQGILNAGQGVPVLGDALVCAQVGSRLAVVLPAEALDPDYDPDAELSGLSYVLVIDVVDVWLGKANGFNQLPQDGMPTVVTAVDGTPGIGVGALAVPEETRTATIKAGGGETVAEGDAAIVHLRSWTWSGTTATVDQVDTWGGYTPARLTVDPADASDSLPTAFYEALIGATIGSQLLVVVPDGSGSATVIVVDVLGIDHGE